MNFYSDRRYHSYITDYFIKELSEYCQKTNYIITNEYSIYMSSKQFYHTVTAYLVIFKPAKR